jgi:hypothetical protein
VTYFTTTFGWSSSGESSLSSRRHRSTPLPEELRDLPAPPRAASAFEEESYEAKFTLRARWRMMRRSPPEGDGATRWRCPFCAGFSPLPQLSPHDAPL